MTYIYLDRQMFIYFHQEDSDVNNHIKKLKKEGVKFPYSPAQIE